VGSIYEPADKLGLASLLGILLRTGGTKQMTPEEVDKTFDDMAANVGTGIGLEMGEASVKCLSKDTQKTLSLFFDLLFSPRFDAKRIELGKINIIEALKREDDYPAQVVSREFKKLVYGGESPWARRPTDKTVNGLSFDDLLKFHENYFVPANMIIAAAGDFQTASFLNLIEGLTGGIPNHNIEFPKVLPVELKFPNQERLIEKPLTQSYIEMGHLGIKRHNPDKYALEIMDMILGAPIFKSRLMEDIRSNRGLAYSIASDFGWGTDYGLFDVYAATKVQSTAEVIKLVKEHLEKLSEKGDVTQAEMDFAKKSVLNRLIFEFDNSFKIVNQRARYRFYGYPDNYWHIYRSEIEKVTISDVRRVAHKYLHPDGLSLVIVGPALSKISN
jgi:predicted Zn-dependent peptidase